MFSQDEINELTYKKTQDINFFNSIKNGTQVNKYVTVSDNSVSVGDTLILGTPTSEETATRTYSGSYGTKAQRRSFTI